MITELTMGRAYCSPSANQQLANEVRQLRTTVLEQDAQIINLQRQVFNLTELFKALSALMPVVSESQQGQIWSSSN